MSSATLDSRASAKRSSDRLSDDQESNDLSYKVECDAIRDNIRTQLKYATIGKSILLDKDVQEYMKWIDEKFMKQTAPTYKDQAEQLKEHQTKYVPNFIKQSQTFSAQFYEEIQKAEKEGALNKSNIANLERIVLKRNTDWATVKDFFEGKDTEKNFKAWVKNWAKIAKKTKEVEAYVSRLQLKTDALPELIELERSRKDGKVIDRMKLLDEALHALTRYEERQSTLYKKAEFELSRSVNGQRMSASEIQSQLQRIFTKYSGKALEEYVLKTLPKRAEERAPEMKEFEKISAQAKKKGHNVLSYEEFFQKSYKERQAELAKMKVENTETLTFHPLLREAEKRIDDNNIAGAETLIQQAMQMPLSADDWQCMSNLRQMIASDNDSASRVQGSAEVDPYAELHKRRTDVLSSLQAMHPDMRQYYSWALEEGGPRKWARMRRLRVWTYNIKWAHDHGFIPNEQALMDIREDAHDDTENIMQYGHRGTGVEKIHLGKVGGGNTSKHRQFEGGRSRGPMYIVHNRQTKEELRECVDEELTNERKNYWGLSLPDSNEVTLQSIIRVHEEFHPKLKALEQAERAVGEQNSSLHYRMTA